MPPSVSLRSPPTPQVGVGKKKMDSPFRLAPLATHPLSGVGKKKMDAPFHLALLATHPPKWEGAGKIRRRLPREAGGRKADTI